MATAVCTQSSLGERVAQRPVPPTTTRSSMPGQWGVITQRKPWVAKLQLRACGFAFPEPSTPALPSSDKNSLL